MKLSLKSATALSLAVSLQLLGIGAFAALFQDLQGNWASNAIQDLSGQNIITGYPDGSFRPNGSITRAEFSAVMVKALNLNSTASGTQTFNDVPSNNWAYPAIETVKSAGLVSGYPGGLFAPSKNLTRAEAISIMSNASRMPMPSDAIANQILSGYRDSSSIPNWARVGVAAAIQSGIYASNPNAGNSINPTEPATRADVAAMVENLRSKLNLANNSAPQPGQSIQPQNVLNGGQGLQGYVSTSVPANTRFTGTLQSGVISSELNKVGDAVTLKLEAPLMSSDNRVVVPANSQIMGSISQIEAAGRSGKNAVLDINFTEIVTPTGQRLPIQASVATEDGMLHGGTTKGRIINTAGRAAIGAGLGAALGTAMGPLSGGKVGKGAVYGTAVGGGLGALAGVAAKGKDVSIASGEKVEIKLDQALNLNP
jgi:S-layer homology domain